LKRQKHDWQSLARHAVDPTEMTLDDLFEEIRCAVSDNQGVQELACMLDDGRYRDFGGRIATLLMIMGGKPNNKTAPAKRRTAKEGAL
jgi:hypothetical protein